MLMIFQIIYYSQRMPSIRRARIEDLHQIQNCNLWCLPQNYMFQYYLYHYLSWSSLIYVAEENGQVCGYVLAKMDDQSDSTQKDSEAHGHITSLSVLRTHRRLGLANKLMLDSHQSTKKVQSCKFVSLHVRVSNRAALGLYRDRLGYKIKDRSINYYADGQDAYEMQKDLTVGA